MAYLVYIETTASTCSIALSMNDTIIALSEVYPDKSHASKITILIDQVVSHAGITMKDLSAVVLSSGPGSYTGLRIGASAAKGLCYALEIPLIAIDTLAVLCEAIPTEIRNKHILCPMLDARRMEVYCAFFDHHRKKLNDTEAKVIDEQSFTDVLAKDSVLFFGSGALKCMPLLDKNPNAHFLSGINASAKHMISLGYQKFSNKDFVDAVYFEPFYLKEFQRFGK